MERSRASCTGSRPPTPDDGRYIVGSRDREQFTKGGSRRSRLATITTSCGCVGMSNGIHCVRLSSTEQRTGCGQAFRGAKSTNRRSWLHGRSVAHPGWTALVDQPQTEAEERAFKEAVARGQPFGDEDWCRAVKAGMGVLRSGVRGRRSNASRRVSSINDSRPPCSELIART